jgi:CBS domain containing-hemolysin-like protein
MWQIGLAIAASLGLVLTNAFFVASEFAIVKIRPTRLVELTEKGTRRARLALGISRHLDVYLSANQLGITLSSLALGWLGEPAFASLFRSLFGRYAWVAGETVAVIAGFSVITLLHTVIGELAPKSLAIQRTETVALWTAAPLRAFHLVTYPFIWILNGAARVVLRLLRLRPATESESFHSPEELRLVLHNVALDPGARRLIDRVFDYTHRVARHVMTLRRDVVVLESGLTFAENLQRVMENQFTRYPLLDSSTGRVLGYVHIKDLMAALVARREPKILELRREPIYATEETALEVLRRQFQQRHVHLAIVTGDAGLFSGIVTLEDLLEEFVGEIRDEQDVGEIPPIVLRSDGGFEIDGRVTLDVAARELGLRIVDAPEAVDTVGAYVTFRLGTAPRAGDTVQLELFLLTVLELRDRRVRRLRGDPLTPLLGGHQIAH